MYPQQDLNRLAAHKTTLQRDIAVRRAQCLGAASHVAQPLAWLDQATSFWKDLSPLTKAATVPLGLMVQRLIFPRMKILGTLLRWGPLAVTAARALGSLGKPRSKPAGA